MSLNPYLKIYDDNNLKNLNAQKNLIEENANKNIARLNFLNYCHHIFLNMD